MQIACIQLNPRCLRKISGLCETARNLARLGAKITPIVSSTVQSRGCEVLCENLRLPARLHSSSASSCLQSRNSGFPRGQSHSASMLPAAGNQHLARGAWQSVQTRARPRFPVYHPQYGFSMIQNTRVSVCTCMRGSDSDRAPEAHTHTHTSAPSRRRRRRVIESLGAI